MYRQIGLSAGIVLACLPVAAHADVSARADSHAPIGVMGDHTHHAGEWMLSYRFMSMDMDGNLKGSSSIDPDTIATLEPNRFAGMPGMPPTLRIVPLDMQMEMHMFGAMYAPGDRLTLMFMASYLDKRMSHVTYQGGAGDTVLGTFTTRTSGLGDSSVSGLIQIAGGNEWRAHLTVGLSLPTGSTDETDEILTPMNMRPVVRVPYPMQLGSGSFDPIAGVTIASDHTRRLSWGAQWRSVFRFRDNSDDYRLGDEHRVTGWLAYSPSGPFSTSLRAEYFRRGNISGRDPEIAGPVQTADPSRQGIDRIDIALGFNLAGQGRLKGWRLGVEYLVPVSQDLDGPQLETDSQWLAGLQYSIY